MTNITLQLASGPPDVALLIDAMAVDSASDRIYATPTGINTLFIIDGSTNKTVQQLVLREFDPAEQLIAGHSIAVDEHTGRVYVTDATRDVIYVVDGRKGTVVSRITIPLEKDAQLTVDSANHRLFLVHHDLSAVTGAGFLQVIDTQGEATVYSVPISNGPREVAYNPKTQRIYVWTLHQGTGLSVLDSSTYSLINRVTFPQIGYDQMDLAVVDPSLSAVFAVTTYRTSKSLLAMDPNYNSLLGSIPITNNIDDVAVYAKNHHLYMSYHNPLSASGSDYVSMLAVFDVSDPQRIRRVSDFTLGTPPEFPLPIVVNQANGNIYMANANQGTIAVISDANAMLGRGVEMSGMASATTK